MDTEQTQPLDMDAIKARLAGKRGRQYWRTLGELFDDQQTHALMADEIPQTTRLADLHMDRRKFLTLAGASLALAGLSGCRFKEQKKLVPFVRKPEEVIEGIPLFYATAIPSVGGYGVGAIVTSREGRPIKLEGNPEHPASMGRLDAFGQASILPMYDPDRSQVVTSENEVSSWKEFFDTARGVFARQREGGGASLRILTETVTSPTLLDQMQKLLAQYPNAKWVQYEPAGRDEVRKGALAAFGEPVNTFYDFSKASRVLSLDADFLLSMPGSIRYGRDFINGRRIRGTSSEMNRLYVAECTPSITGAVADHKLPLRPSQIEAFTRAVAQGLGVSAAAGAGLSATEMNFVSAVVNDLKTAPRGTTVVVPGDFQPAAVHALAHAMNDALGNVGTTVLHTDPIETSADQLSDLRQLAADLRDSKVDVLLILGGNPVYTAPADLNFAELVRRPALRIHLSEFEDETSELCQWHLPQANFLEAWSDIRAYDGTASLIQPLIQPLYNGRSAHEILSGLTEEPRDGYAIVHDYWSRQGEGELFDFNKLLHDGVIANTAAKARAVTLKPDAVASLAATPVQTVGVNGAQRTLEVAIRPDPTIWDGRHSNNGWLQELPKPLVKLTWDNAAYINLATAQKYNLDLDTDYARPADMLELSYQDNSVSPAVTRSEIVPIIIQPGCPDDTVTIFLGYGRTRAGSIGNDIGFNAYKLFSGAAPWNLVCSARKTGDKYLLAVTTHHQTMEGRDIIRVSSITQFRKDPTMAPEEEPSRGSERSVTSPGASENLAAKNSGAGEGKALPNIYNQQEWKYPQPNDTQYGAYNWGMSIDIQACIGCNACMVACQAENNIPIVGKQQVLVGRHMNWIRIDTYYETRGDDVDNYTQNPGTYFQPLMCVHCEQAPCEPVCPVAATIHSHEGLNQMVYNRCIGTKYCSNNCPYKVRRFNFLNYANHWDIEVVKMRNNPEVTVRGRGVMEKCSYCVQRINGARQKAKQQERDLHDGEILTACQQTCPTNAIVFGNITDANSEVAKLKTLEQNYGLLADLNTRPRTTYLGRVRNPNPELEQG